MLFNSKYIKDMIGSCRPEFNPQYRQNFLVGIFQDLSTLTDLNWIVSMVKSDLMVSYSISDCSCGSKSNWALVHLCTCKAAANRSNVYVSEKIIIYSLFLRQFKVYQPAWSQRKKGAKKNYQMVYVINVSKS